MKAHHKIVIIAWAVLVLPSLVYVVANGYWWLFDGNVINQEKMSWAMPISIIGTILIGFALTSPGDY